MGVPFYHNMAWFAAVQVPEWPVMACGFALIVDAECGPVWIATHSRKTLGYAFFHNTGNTIRLLVV
jgi:hypothetical protein